MIIILFMFCGKAESSQEYVRLKAGIHFDSEVSGGQYSLEELAHIIGKSNLDVAIITDHDNMEVRYGFAFFRKAFQFPVLRNSVHTYGFENYFNKIDDLNKFFPNVEIIPGIEAVPYYSWEGNPITGNLVLKNWHRHLLVFGLQKIEDYKNLPSLKNGFPTNPIPRASIIKKLPYYTTLLLLLIFGLLSMALIVKKGKITLLTVLCPVMALYVLFVEFPYLPWMISPYHSNSDTDAFQCLIDYVHERKGLVYWAHPEATYTQDFPIPLIQKTILLTTDPYSYLVYQTKNHSGFAGFWEGMKSLGKPGGLWDLALTEYCKGLRPVAPYVIGELDFEETNDLKLINETNTFLFCQGKSREAIFEAMRQGRMYTTRNFLGEKLVIEEFRAYNLATESSAFIGETLKSGNTPIAIHIKIRATGPVHNQKFTLWRNDIPIKQLLVNGSVEEWIVDENHPNDEKFYYKFYGGDDWITLVTNPIFVEPQ
ncbi:MAG: hypothetical protein JXQ65_08480 [Candidatus Marinimicrobia bacterium]|nr:hypothetical protein [Candidatus Neomarinimicrobiota bacterium]